jgi:hypothetical protein
MLCYWFRKSVYASPAFVSYRLASIRLVAPMQVEQTENSQLNVVPLLSGIGSFANACHLNYVRAAGKSINM